MHPGTCTTTDRCVLACAGSKGYVRLGLDLKLQEATGVIYITNNYSTVVSYLFEENKSKMYEMEKGSLKVRVTLFTCLSFSLKID